MRVIRTELYFDPVEVGSLTGLPGVSVAWVRVDEEFARFSRQLGEHGNALGQFAVQSDTTIESLQVSRVTAEEFRDTLVFTVVSALYGNETDRSVHPGAIRSVFDAPVVVEQSPPQHISLNAVVAAVKRNATGVGAFVGMLAGSDYPPLMLITVPLGMIVVGSAPGVTKAIESGLVGVINKLFDQNGGRPAGDKTRRR